MRAESAGDELAYRFFPIGLGIVVAFDPAIDRFDLLGGELHRQRRSGIFAHAAKLAPARGRVKRAIVLKSASPHAVSLYPPER